MICPYCDQESGALQIYPEIGMACPRCRDRLGCKEIHCRKCGRTILPWEFQVTLSNGHVFCEDCIMEQHRYVMMQKKREEE